MTAPLHPARTMPFNVLYEGLEACRAAGHVLRKDCSHTGRAIYVYSQSCVYDNAWNEFSLLARGLILHPESKRIIATPFPKFFNFGERGNETIPDLPFEVFEKIDGSLIILHWIDGKWRTATKGAFDSPQAVWAERFIEAYDVASLNKGDTYLFEAVYPENRIVVRYDKPELVLLAAYQQSGEEQTYQDLVDIADRFGCRVSSRYPFESFLHLIDDAKILPATEEGYVIRFANGYRLKLKGDEYRRIHALISHCTPLAMWNAMQAGDDMAAIRKDLPEEFHADFDAIVGRLENRIQEVIYKVHNVAKTFSSATDKELGLQFSTLDPDVRPFIFHWRKSGGKIDGRARGALFRHIRPTGNHLEGYTPSYAMGRVMEDIG